MAFYIIDVHKAKKYRLLDVEGIAIRPNVNTVKRGKRYGFQIIFEKISMKRFHLIEGSAKFANETAWYFTNLLLETIKKTRKKEPVKQEVQEKKETLKEEPVIESEEEEETLKEDEKLEDVELPEPE